MSNASPSSEVVTDTMALVLWLEGRRMPQLIKQQFQMMEAGEGAIHIPTMVLAELLYLSEKQRIQITLNQVKQYLETYPRGQEASMTLTVIQAAAEITDIPELHDRLISGTARLLGLPLMTNDSVIQSSSFVDTMWS